MIRKTPPPFTQAEETADFRKPAQITNVSYTKLYNEFLAAAIEHKPQSFLKYCLAVIKQKDNGSLTIRESAFAMSSGFENAGLNIPVNGLIAEATALRRHPSNYKADHNIGWANLVENITKLRKIT